VTGRASSLLEAECWFVGGDRKFVHLIDSVVTTTSIILSTNKILVPAYLVCPEKIAVKRIII